MAKKARTKEKEVIYRDGKPSAVIIDLEEYREMLERLEEIDDLKAIEEMKKAPLQFRPLDEFLKEFSAT